MQRGGERSGSPTRNSGEITKKSNSFPGGQVEIKNMNSFSAMQRAIEFETTRQTALEREGRGEEIVLETRLWDEEGKVGGGMWGCSVLTNTHLL